MNSRGFVATPMFYGMLALGTVAAGLGVALKVQSSRLETCRVEFEVFRVEIKRLGEAQDKANREKESADKKLKERTDADHKTTIARLNRDINRLRDVHARSSLTPEVTPASRRLDLACFDRAEFARALRQFEGEIEAIVGEGAARAVELDLAKAWAQSLP